MYKLNRQSIKSSTFQGKPSHSDSLKQFKHTNVKLKSPFLEGVKSANEYVKPKTEETLDFSGRRFIVAHNFFLIW